MTTIELAGRLARRLRGGNLTALSMNTAMDVLEAINAGLQECYDLLPPWQRRTTVALDLAAPATLSISVLEGSVSLQGGGSLFDSSHIGRSVVVAGDTNWNEVQSSSMLLDAYLGSSGVKSATVYGDAIYNELATLDGFSSHLRFADTREELQHYNPRLAGLPAQIGKPKYYWVEPASGALGASPAVYLRVSPAPDRAYALRMDMEFRPVRITYSSLHQASTVPLQEQLLERCLIPLCELRLLRSPEWLDNSKADLVVDDADRARALLSTQRPSPGVPTNRVGTPPGY